MEEVLRQVSILAAQVQILQAKVNMMSGYADFELMDLYDLANTRGIAVADVKINLGDQKAEINSTGLELKINRVVCQGKPGFQATGQVKFGLLNREVDQVFENIGNIVEHIKNVKLVYIPPKIINRGVLGIK